MPGIFQVLAVDLRVANPSGSLYNHLHLRGSSPLSRLQREMVATVVNGKVGGGALTRTAHGGSSPPDRR